MAFAIYFFSLKTPLEEGLAKHFLHLAYIIAFLVIIYFMERKKYLAEFRS